MLQGLALVFCHGWARLRVMGFRPEIQCSVYSTLLFSGALGVWRKEATVQKWTLWIQHRVLEGGTRDCTCMCVLCVWLSVLNRHVHVPRREVLFSTSKQVGGLGLHSGSSSHAPETGLLPDPAIIIQRLSPSRTLDVSSELCFITRRGASRGGGFAGEWGVLG